jgi:ankyrin repeat protein
LPNRKLQHTQDKPLSYYKTDRNAYFATYKFPKKLCSPIFLVSPSYGFNLKFNSMNLEKACRLGDVRAIRTILETTPELVNEVDGKIGWTPVYRAVICSHVEATKTLLELGADPNIQNKLGETPLHKAVDSGCGRIVRLLLDKGADVGLTTIDGETALHVAALK